MSEVRYDTNSEEEAELSGIIAEDFFMIEESIFLSIGWMITKSIPVILKEITYRK